MSQYRMSISMTVAMQKRRKKKNHSSYGGYKLFLSEDRLEVMRVDCSIASIPPFRIDILSSSKSIWFGAEMTRAEPNDKVEPGEVLGLPHLSPGQYLDSRKILKVLMIHNNVNEIGQTFQIVSPNLESFNNSLLYVL